MTSRESLENRLERIYDRTERRNSGRSSRLSSELSVYADENTDDLDPAEIHDLDCFDTSMQSNALEMREFSVHRYNKFEADQELVEIFGPSAIKTNQVIEIVSDELNPSMCTMLSLMNQQFSDEQMVQIEEERDALGLTPIYKCLNIPHHLGQARIICFEIVKSLSSLSNCIETVAHWCRSRIFQKTSMEIENRWIMMNIFFSYIDFGIITKEGIIFFESFSELSTHLKIPVTYRITKQRFAFPKYILDELSENENELMEIMFSSCFYAPRYKSEKNSEIKNFAHNDILHEFSSVMRRNLMCALIYYRHRSVIHDQNIFQSYQRIFRNGCDYLNNVLYSEDLKHPVAPELKVFLVNLRRMILDKRLFARFMENMYKCDNRLTDD